ncbi:glycosyltransferase family 2 protein [Duganella callida]|uniref:Glycosyltransferase family 2 protein n=1 Tax=Duganella callida TaxID=2561932 RepID=A0A4Y9S4N8_9BURK|nr:glycosyltransferase family 2 protein [Duganella callida]TFW16411.1 glycosyltransferase family 2 protein [Duganella callida]
MSAPPVAVVLLNWNGWADTIECLETLLRSDYPDFRVIVCDNASSDGSLERIEEWAAGRLAAGGDAGFARLRATPLAKPVDYLRLDATQALQPPPRDVPLTLIDTGGNLGFAGGNNVGLRYALASGRYAYYWLLNNDTVIEADALRRLVARMQDDPRAGIAGSTLRHYYAAQVVQVAGGSAYNPWRCRALPLAANQPAAAPLDAAAIERRMAYVAGASMLVSDAFLREIGLMAEDYFLYFEELDWACRAAGRYHLAYAPDSLVYHKEGGSIGTGGRGKLSATALYYLQHNRLKFTRRFFPARLPLLYLSMLAELARAALRRDFFEIKWSLVALLGLPPRGLSTRKRQT